MRDHYFDLDSADPASAMVASHLSTFPATLAPYVRGYNLRGRFHFLRRNAEGSERPFRFVDPAGWAVTVGISEIGAEPTGGSWTFTSGAQTTAAIAWNASAAAVQSAIRTACTTNFPSCVVTGEAGGPYLVDRGATGALATPSANDDALSPPSSKVSITPSQTGTSVFPAQFFIELTRAVPIGRSSGWTALPAAAVTPTVHQAGGTNLNKVFRVAWNEDAFAGEISLLFTGDTTTAPVGPFRFNAIPADIVAAFEAHPDVEPGGVAVAQASPGEIYVTCVGVGIRGSDVPALANSSNSLQVPLGLEGTLNANTPGVLDLLDGEEEATATFEVRADMGDGPQCVCQIADAKILATILGDFVGVSNPIDPPMTEAAAEVTWPILTGDASELDHGTIDFAILPAPLNEADPLLSQFHFVLPLWVQDSIDIAGRTPTKIGCLLYDQEAARFYVADDTTAGAWDGQFETPYLAADQLRILLEEIEILTPGKGVLMKSPNGNNWRITVSNGGALVVASA